MNAVWLSPHRLCTHIGAKKNRYSAKWYTKAFCGPILFGSLPAKQGPDLQTLVPSGLDWLKAITGGKPLPQSAEHQNIRSIEPTMLRCRPR